MSVSAPRRGGTTDPARLLAWEVLRAVDERGAYANLLLPALLSGRRLSPRDRGFATELTYGSLRAQGTLDGVLDTVTSRPVASVDPPVRDALRLGAYQLLSTRVPPRAAVASTVDLVRATCGERPVRFANAVLRRVAARIEAAAGDIAVLLSAPDIAEDPAGHLAVVTAHPRWIVDVVLDALGGDVAGAHAALAANDTRPAVHLVARPGRIDAEALVAQAASVGLGARRGAGSPYAVHLDGGDPGSLPAVAAGDASVQDEGSQLVTLALASVPTIGRDTGLTVDLCAGPGGKAALLAALQAVGEPAETVREPAAGGHRPPPARLLALEPRAARAGLVAASLAGFPAALAVRADGRFPPVRPGMADRVLVDVPCSGLGALRRRPEARWRRTPADVAALVPLQRQLLVAALDLVRPGGAVAYVTCSPHPEETSEVVTAIAQQRGDVAILDARRCPPFAGPPFGDGAPGGLGDGPFVQLWPHLHGTDAMFLALLRRADR
ncbi:MULTISPECIES: RsmB/NOP family class I SAM-dependent RNA methyltransferase [unclassified Parafrankia]|uniref:RsmB/NOP family class I SAM-dependent RNA methyltransferase n=1 Tax=unclassified Parafrankia TaxID=2994368 RepID=UPI000DA5035A|nr:MULTISPECIES: transcription antitermination factor NusB [unclassified Parafrankia]TCJ34835.1 rRNA cytosine-C5-methyltransferase [Parafrankia sp. BMG5.11]CAI7977677.1 putative methyltransferase Rv1407 [Frankia sp. Hr75.2]SQD93916.1 putative enzyme [Parafrankia sp. Ea1.12]